MRYLNKFKQNKDFVNIFLFWLIMIGLFTFFGVLIND